MVSYQHHRNVNSVSLTLGRRLVATLGSKSTLKKVSRKAILDVDIEKACETIVEPTAPMALRLQSNLLYVLRDSHGI